MLTQPEWEAQGTHLRALDAIYIHVTDSPPETTIQDVDRWHRANGWLGVGYHDLVRYDASTRTWQTQQGRPDDIVGAQCEGQNWHSLGFAFAWQKPHDLPPEPALKQMEQTVVAHILRSHKAGRAIKLSHIYGHRDACQTACPGDTIYAWIYAKGGLRERVAKYLPPELIDWRVH